ncbi:MAG: hypothetical protein M4D80_26570 [Myxococcota bacterium]|nr:hypothetical protein [Deltaproteobacteria bacterium]MDQ3338746.1 hypothetical protein [Myxococcota bacterium]
MDSRLVIAGFACFTIACADEQAEPESGSARFVGPWLVEETMPHATYGASAYELRADGTLALTWDAGIIGISQGHVRSPDRSITCEFGGTWTSIGALLVIDGDCSDGVARAIELELTSSPSSNASGATVVIRDVGEEPGWQPPQWGWALRKCADVATCRTSGI